MTTKEFYLFANPGKPETVAAVKALADALLEKGCGVLLDTWLFEGTEPCCVPCQALLPKVSRYLESIWGIPVFCLRQTPMNCCRLLTVLFRGDTLLRSV
jgi:hypothetical protein